MSARIELTMASCLRERTHLACGVRHPAEHRIAGKMPACARWKRALPRRPHTPNIVGRLCQTPTASIKRWRFTETPYNYQSRACHDHR